MSSTNPRLRALTDLSVPTVREYAGRHEYDGQVQDLSPTGVAQALAGLGGDPVDDLHDEAHLRVFEEAARVWYGDLQWHRRSPLVHLANLDLACYDRAYAPEDERQAARRAHLARWPDAVAMAVEALDRVPAPTATALLDSVRGLAGAVRPDDGPTGDTALGALARLVDHLEQAARQGDPDPALGGAAIARGLAASEGVEVDLDRLADAARAERDRITGMLDEACRRLDPDRPTGQVVADLLRDHPPADRVLQEARALTAEALEFTRSHRLVPHLDGECLVGPSPQSRRWAMAMMSAAAPGEAEGPSWYHITPPDPSWPAEEQEDWLAVFSRTTLPAITVHEVAPGHFAHARALRRVASPVRQVLQSEAFVEGWAHHVEEVCLEEGFRATDPRFAAGVALEALVRVTRLACAIGLHRGEMTVEQAAEEFARHAHYHGPAALSEARRGTFDPTYGRYTWGKLAIRDLRDQARARWGPAYSHQRFHAALLDLGSPPLGLMSAALG